MDDNFNSVDGNPPYWVVNPTSPNEYQRTATPTDSRSWSRHEQEQTFNPQDAPHLTEMFDRDTQPASQEGNLGRVDATFYNDDGSQHNSMSENDYALRETSGVEGTHGNVQGFASGQE
jgi:hypothetical protein